MCCTADAVAFRASAAKLQSTLASAISTSAALNRALGLSPSGSSVRVVTPALSAAIADEYKGNLTNLKALGRWAVARGAPLVVRGAASVT